ncbi:FAD-dependent oxidoreductase [Ferrimonas futtsuensis]|uniref:FAD-dependent oxidoreductase n=1 Tax=Ferrimonas futtsuensis TaxID=364764 RepID=UPI000415CD97|nr:FAD-dependent oxidoreductase [Ferrimonas futtsuensis]
MKGNFKLTLLSCAMAMASHCAFAKTINLNTDIAVIGGGSTGMSAAVAGAEKGAKVIVLEKNVYLGGSSAFAEGLFAVESESQRQQSYGLSKDEAFKHIVEFSHYKTNIPLIRDFVNHSADNIDWLHQQGIEFKAIQISPTEPLVWHEIEKKDHLIHGAVLIGALQEKAKEMGVEIMTRTPASSLIYESGKVTGVKAKDHKGNDIVIHAKAVIIGTGGFGNSVEKINEWTEFDGTKFKPTLPLNKTGDGIEMARNIGADHEGENLMLHPGTEGKGIIPLGALYTMTWQPNNMWVNNHGERFVDEAIAFSFAQAGNAIARQRDNYAWAIFDDYAVDYAATTGVDNGVGVMVPVTTKLSNIRQEIKQALAAKGNNFKSADSIKGLAKEIGVSAKTLQLSYDNYNKYAGQHYDEEFVKEHRWLRPIDHGKLYAVKLLPYHFTSIGGLKVNRELQVLGANEQPIPGLYVGGNDVGGLYSDTYTLWASGHAFAWATYSGRKAALSAVDHMKHSK